MPPKHQGTKWRRIETELEAGPKSVTDNQTNGMPLTENRNYGQSSEESRIQADSGRVSSSNASTSGMGTSRSANSGTSNDGGIPTMSEGGSNSNNNTHTTGGWPIPLTRDDIPRLVWELARQDPQSPLVRGMFTVTCDYCSIELC